MNDILKSLEGLAAIEHWSPSYEYDTGLTMLWNPSGAFVDADEFQATLELYRAVIGKLVEQRDTLACSYYENVNIGLRLMEDENNRILDLINEFKAKADK